MRRLFAIFLVLIVANEIINAADFPEIDGWKPIGEMTTYQPDNLWEYINGAAGLFIDYGFEFLQVKEFARDSTKVTIDVYDMGSALQAFGIYVSERSPQFTPLSFGTEAVLFPPSQALMLKDKYYFKIYAFEGQLSEENGKHLLASLNQVFTGKNNYPEELQLLPDENKIPGSEGFTLEAYLGLSELKSAVYARYQEAEDENFQYFSIILPPDTIVANFTLHYFSKWQKTELHGKTVLYRNIPYQGLVGVILLEKQIFGVTEVADETELLDRLAIFIE
jgi:hypothetical protein